MYRGWPTGATSQQRESLRQPALINSRPTPQLPHASARHMLTHMESLELTLTYGTLLSTGGHRLILDVFPTIPTSHRAEVDAFKTHFGLRETNEVAGLRSLRGSASLEQVLSFFGATWSDAVLRWPTLSWMRAYRREHGDDAYASVDAWQQFYALLSDKIVPAQIEVAMIEHY
jgi:hypothetical protein